MPVTALVPVNHLEVAKSRLAGALSDRRALVLEMLGTVLEALKPLPTLVVSPDPSVAAHVGEAQFLLQHGTGLNEALEQARARAEGPLLIALADLPRLTAHDVQALLAHPEDVVLAPDERQEGTNLMLLRRPFGPFRYGPGSFLEHFTRALEHGLSVAVHRSPGTVLDLDEPAQLAWTSCS